jgi:alanine racemase
VSYTLADIARILSVPDISSDAVVSELITDSRKITYPEKSLFFALTSSRRNGHDFLSDAYKAGVRAFVVSESVDKNSYPDAFFIQVPDTLAALQQLAVHHRRQFDYPVIGITGSNGKTVVKDWLYQLLCADHQIVRSPRSYNSQIGVPLSVWRMDASHDLAIFEAGISQPGEMDKLAAIIRPTIGVLTHIGAAHDEGFSSRAEKEQEKRILFASATQPEPIRLASRTVKDDHTELTDEKGESICIPFTDEASVQNALTCWSVMRLLGYSIEVIAPRMSRLQPVQMRLEIKRGVNQCLILNDAYSLDLDSLSIALSHLRQQSGDLTRTAILSDLPEGRIDSYDALIDLLKMHQVSRLIAIGPVFTAYLSGRTVEDILVQAFPDRSSLESSLTSHSFSKEAILLKGARAFELENLLPLLEAQLHQTRLEIDLHALRQNIRTYQSVLKSGVKIMAMVKSFAYGSGGVEIARVMQEEGISYLGVAYADEGVALRAGGIRIPIMVMNAEPTAFDSMVEHRLEPVLYAWDLVQAFHQYLQRQGELNYPVHIEVETGMHRLGMEGSELERTIELLTHTDAFRVQSIFSHLSAGEDPREDAFSSVQFERLGKAIDLLRTRQGNFLRHIANSAAAIRKPDWQLDMVRIGIGLYGIDPAVSDRIQLQPVARLLATVAQIKTLQPGDSVSYNRKTIVDHATRIATVRLGYADGFPRRLGNGVGHVMIRGKKAPVVGTVCMDMFMVDITDVSPVQVGDEVIVFGAELPITELAALAGTIPYEIMTGISQRVKRVYVEES